MDQNSVISLAVFRAMIETRLGSFFSQHGLRLSKTCSLRGGLYVSVSYESTDVSLGFYKDMPEGEVNAKLARAGAGSLEASGWVYIRRLMQRIGNAPISATFYDVPSKPQSFEQQIDILASELEAHFEIIRKAITEELG